MTDPVVLPLREAAKLAGCSPAWLRRAAHATDPHGNPPPLDARRKGRQFVVTLAELRRWADSLPPA